MRYLLFLFCIAISYQTIAQKQLVDYSAQELEVQKKEAVSKDNMADAAVYKKALDIRIQLDLAVQTEDYAKAANLKNQLKNLSLNDNKNLAKTNKLNEDLKKAVAAEDYVKAAELKKQIETVNNGSNNGAVSTSNALVGAIPTIEFINQVYFWDKATNTIRNLEYDTPEIKTSASGGFGYAQATSFWVVSGTRSDVTINLNETSSFIVKVTPGLNPIDLFRLVKFQILGKRNPSRHMAAYTSSSAAYAGSSTKERHDNDIVINYNKLDEGHYEITVNGKLVPGEYTFFGLGKMYSFSINSSSSTYNSANSNAMRKSENVTNSTATTSYSKYDIYKESNITWYGVDFSLFTFTHSKKLGQESDLLKLLNKWQNHYEKEIPITSYKRWLGKVNLSVDKEISENLYKTNIKQNWISSDYQDVGVTEMQNHLKNYDSNGKGMGLVLFPELFNEDKDNYTVEFVWFDIETKAVIHSQKISGRGHGGSSLMGWGDALTQATKAYIDEYYKKEK